MQGRSLEHESASMREGTCQKHFIELHKSRQIEVG